MKLPRGRLRRRRVVDELGTPLEDALETTLTGYATLEPQDALLLSGDGTGVLTFEGGVPFAAYHTGTDVAGPPALADISGGAPYRLHLFELDADVLDPIHATAELLVPPGMPAEQLAGDQALADRTRSAAPTGPDRAVADSASADRPGPVEAFLADETKIQSIRERARREARRRAEEWGLD